MTLSFHGAAGTVTGSKHLVTLDNDVQLLLDCGMFQGLGARTTSLNSSFGFDPSSLAAVFLSHAHIDHSGLLPKLVADGFRGPIYCTPATKALSEILLMDSAAIQAHAHPDPHHAPCYRPEDVEDTLKLMKVVEFDTWFEAVPDVRALYTRTGHLAGAAAISLDCPSKAGRTSILFSGDVGRGRHPLWKEAILPPQADYLILESTYGDRHHDLLLSNVDILHDFIRDTCLKKMGKLVIPAFSVGRTQELLYVLHQLEAEKRLPEIPYFVDTPLGIAATRLLGEQTGEYGDDLQQKLQSGEDLFAFAGLKFVETSEDSMRLTDYAEPCMIISSSGTADAGRVRFHIRSVVDDPKNTILFSGYCGPESLGGVLLAGKKTLMLGEDEYEVKAEISQLKGLSAHGDADDLVRFAGSQDPALTRGVFLVHGERGAQERLAARLQAKGFHPVMSPQSHESVLLNRHVH